MQVVGYRCRNLRECSLMAPALSLKWAVQLSAESRGCVCARVCTHLHVYPHSFPPAAEGSDLGVDTEKAHRRLDRGSFFQHRFDGRISGSCRIRGPSPKM